VTDTVYRIEITRYADGGRVTLELENPRLHTLLTLAMQRVAEWGWLDGQPELPLPPSRRPPA
jgi:hypothetical protein